MGLMMQESLLLSDRSVIDNVMLPALAAEESYGEGAPRDAGAGEVRHRRIAEDLRTSLRGGKAVGAPARAVVNRPAAVILVDEPVTRAPRPGERGGPSRAPRRLRQGAGVTVVSASHERHVPEGVPVREVRLEAPEALMSYLQLPLGRPRNRPRAPERTRPLPLLHGADGLALAVRSFIALRLLRGLSEPLRNLPLAVEMPIFTDGSVPVEKVAEDVGNIPGVAETSSFRRTSPSRS